MIKTRCLNGTIFNDMYSVAPYWKKSKKCKVCKHFNSMDCLSCSRCSHEIVSKEYYSVEYSDGKITFNIPVLMIAGVLIGTYVVFSMLS